MYIVFECRKCGHELYMDSYNLHWKDFDRLSKRECPECGEEGYENWILQKISLNADCMYREDKEDE